MLEFAKSWSWELKTVLATLMLAIMTITMMFMQKRFGYGGEKFLFAWSLGFVLAFMAFAESSTTMRARDLFTPQLGFIMVLILGFMLGGIANIFLGQAVPVASNPGAVWAIIGANAPIAYIATYGLAKVLPDEFPKVEFSTLNFFGIIVLIVGMVMVMHRNN